MKNVSCFIFCIGILGLFQSVFSQQYLADYSVAKEEVLRSIPTEYVDKARTELVIAYQHTSHGTHVSRGVFGLQDYKAGDEQLFGVSASGASGKLFFRDYALSAYAPSGVTAIDLSVDETAFIQTTRNFLDSSENADVNVIMWSWCDISGHSVSENYLPGMTTLISEYGPGGSMIGSGEGQRDLPVSFIFMTGHANENANAGTLQPKPQSELITSYCNTNAQFCLDYFSIDSHDMENNYWEDVSDDGKSSSYGGNFYVAWQSAHTLGEDYFENKETPGGDVAFGAHNTQHITANRKAYAFWWTLARIAGWDGLGTEVENDVAAKQLIYPNPCSDVLFIRDIDPEIHEIRIVRSDGVTVRTINLERSELNLSIDMSGYAPGFYGISMATKSGIQDSQRVLLIK
jgi:type IX secretion system substrate protein